MLAKERYDAILSRLQAKGAVTTPEIAQTLEVSVETVRRDLLHLEKQGLLQRVHGGAVKVSQMRPLSDLIHRISENQSGKAELCRTAAALVEENDVIFIDSGSTANLFAEAVKRAVTQLTVVTHSLDVFDVLSRQEGMQVILCGGHYLGKERAFYGQLALDMLRRLHVRKAFVCPSAISLKHGIYDFNHELLPIQQQALLCCDRVFILADSGKFEKTSLEKLADLNPAFTYVTDSSLSQQYKSIYEEQGYTVLIK